MLLNWYVGDGTAHKVKKVYLGVNNKAKLVYNPQEIGGIDGNGIRTNAGTSVYASLGGNIGDLYAVKFGGLGNNSYVTTSDCTCVNESTKAPTSISGPSSKGRNGTSPGSVGNYFIVPGGRRDYGYYGNDTEEFNDIIYLNKNLQWSTCSISLSYYNCTYIGMNDYAIFKSNGKVYAFNKNMVNISGVSTSISSGLRLGDGSATVTQTSMIYLNNNFVETTSTYSDSVTLGALATTGNYIVSSNKYVFNKNMIRSQFQTPRTIATYATNWYPCRGGAVFIAKSSGDNTYNGTYLNGSLVQSLMSDVMTYNYEISCSCSTGKSFYAFRADGTLYYWTGYDYYGYI